jgi:putative alpha-1,2-mannosidase
MPTNKQVFNNGADGNPGYKSTFSHENETAEPGFYKVHLEDTNIDVELTVSKLTINRNVIDRNYILHKEIITGGKCVLTMSNQPKE